MIRRLAPILFVTAVIAAACDRAPTDPSVDVESMLAATNPTAAAGIRPLAGSLPALFREAVAQVEKTEGRAGVQALLGDWRRLQDELQQQAATADRVVIQAKLDAIHEEELRIVMTGLGERVVPRVIKETRIELSAAHMEIAAQSLEGADLTRAVMVAQQVQSKLAKADLALSANRLNESLDAASQAAALLGGLEYYLIEIDRIPGLENLLPRAVAKLASESTPDAQALLRRAEQTAAHVRTALRSGDRSTAQAQLVAARAEQIQLVLRVLGPGTAGKLVEEVNAGTAEARTTLAALEAAGRDVARDQRMLTEAVDLAHRARAALAKGDNATALDLGSHAAGLLNALQHLIRK